MVIYPRLNTNNMNTIDKISVVIITYNEESNIERCLRSLQFADEIIIYDGNSTDRTLEICNKYNCKIHQRNEWRGFGIAKQEAVDFAQNNWVLVIDADEELTEKLIEKLIELQNANDSKYSAYKILRKSYFLGNLINYSSWQSDAPLRLFDKRIGKFNQNIVHEFVEVDTEVGLIKEHILHYTYPDLKGYLDKMVKYAELGAEQNFLRGKRSSLSRALLSGILKFIKMYFLRFGILDGKHGLILAINSAFGVYLKHTLLMDKWKLTEKN